MPFQICLFVCCFPLHSSFERALKLGHYETERDGGRESNVCCFLVPHAFYTSSNRNAPPSSYVLAHKGRAVYDMHHTFIDISTYVCVAHVHTMPLCLWLHRKGGQPEREGRDSLLAVHISLWVHLVQASCSVSATRGLDRKNCALIYGAEADRR